jgi:hypothetical protein
MRADIANAIEAAGLPKVALQEISKRSKFTEDLVRALKDVPPEARKAILDSTFGKGGFLALPAAVGVGAATYPDDY